MTKYPQLQQIMDKMKQKGHDYKSPVIYGGGQKFVDNGYWRTLNNYSKRQSGHNFTLIEHVQGFVYAALSCNRPWATIEKHLPEIDVIFNHYDPKALKQANPNELIDKLKVIGCGNRQINPQMKNLSKNIETLERIAQKYGSIDNYFAQFEKSRYFDLVLSLSKKGSEFKLENMGVKLICEYLKNMGIDIVKPDGQINRLLCRIGLIPFAPESNDSNKKFRAVIDTCHDIALEYDLHDFEVDCILWQYCAKDYMEICKDEPGCNECLVVDCKCR